MTSQLQPQPQPQLPLSLRDNVDFRNITNASDPIPSSPPSNSEYDTSRVFWSVNAFILFLIFLTGLWCCFVHKRVFNATDRMIASDQIYRERRRRRLEAEKTESLEERRQKLLASFARHAVQMTVKEEDFINQNEKQRCVVDGVNKDTDCEKNENSYNGVREEESICSIDIDTGEHHISFCSLEEPTGHLKLTTGRLAPNCCAVCLSDYRVGDVVTWSSNPKCIHVFHRDCVVDWLIKIQPETPCPCCRQEFTDLQEIRKERKIKWLGTFAFDTNAVRFW
eukprot:CAMPEP_0197185510 /NCGR_PEP_ID=MMETSP1423-20130617/12091_1 /TAXON_ID=476441 /ORGANISM="Pseudo-nitzschia heimii, Strain UNC1101" /LENGTH=279 /DNA_ID=CAMNT_0042636591 /DNA_START=13 /DNA_END=852 /DNA_ORIENTATION=+